MPRERSNFVCSVDGCEQQAHAKGWCRQHWARMHLYGRLDKVNGLEKGLCKAENCTNPIKGKGLCANHYQMNRLYGRINKVQKESKTAHPFYHLWFERKQNKDLLPEWLDFWIFVKDITPKPEGNYYLIKIQEGPYGPLNFKWSEKLKQELDETNKEWWARKWEDRRIRNPDEEYDRNLKRNYGISLEQYKEMLISQDEKCAICKQKSNLKHHKTGVIKNLSVDHCHTTGKIRELLCWQCNTTLGSVKDSIELLQAMIDYLTKHSEAQNG